MPAFDVLEPSIMVKVGPWGLEKLGTQMRLLTGLESDFQWGGLSFVLGSLSRGKPSWEFVSNSFGMCVYRPVPLSIIKAELMLTKGGPQ